jgi:hypothetical protein
MAEGPAAERRRAEYLSTGGFHRHLRWVISTASTSPSTSTSYQYSAKETTGYRRTSLSQRYSVGLKVLKVVYGNEDSLPAPRTD